MKKKAVFRRFMVGLLAAAVVFPGTFPGFAQAKEGAETRNVNLNVGGNIAGIGDPTSAGTGSDVWSGDRVYFGSYQGSSINWRVLDANTKGIFNEKETMLLLSNSILDKWIFRKDSWALDSKEWLPSDARAWIDAEIYQKFQPGEKEAVAASTKAALAEDETELQNWAFAPLEDDRLFLLDGAELKSAYGYDNSRARGIGGDWWTRSAITNMYNHQGAFCPIGNAVARGGYEAKGIVPACNLDLSKVAFATQAFWRKAEEFTLTENGEGVHMWNLTLTDGSGFQAERESGGNVSPGGQVTVRVTDLASGNRQPYTRISAMLVDKRGTVIAYGKVSDEIQKGSLSFSIPQGVPEGSYTLKLFEESGSGESPYIQTSFASNMAELPLIIGEPGQEGTEPPETEPAETEPPETEPPETEPAETEAPETEPAETEPLETEPAETEPAETEPPETEPAETEAPETEAPETEPAETEAPETEPAGTEPLETEPAETESPETEPPETEPPETEPPETEAPETKTSETESPETTVSGKTPTGDDSGEGKITAKRPLRPQIRKINRTARAFRIKWKNSRGKVNGYQIQYSTNKNFKGAKVRTVNVKRAGAVQKRITGLKAKRRYYVRIRAFRTVENKKIYSLWSLKKRI